MADIKVDNFLGQGENKALQNLHDQPRSLKDFIYPTRTIASSCIVFFF